MSSSSDGPEFYLGPDEFEPPRHDIRRKSSCVMPWCVYCGYDFKLGDQLLTQNNGERKTWVVTSLSLTLSHMPSWEVEFQPLRRGVSKRRRLCACGLSEISRCKYGGSGSQACHKACHGVPKPAMIGTPYPTMVDCYKVRRSGFKPTASDSQRRRAFMGAELVSLLGECITNLPWELLYQIAGYGSSYYATAHLRTRMGNQEPRDSSFDLRKDIWAEYVDFEGQTYIRALSNTTPDVLDGVFRGTWKLIFSAKPYRPTYIMLIEMCPLGIRRIIFTDDSSRPEIEEKPDIWWKAMRFQDGRLVVAETDGVKLRGLTFRSDRYNQFPSRSRLNIMWPTPAKYDHYTPGSERYNPIPTPRSYLTKYPLRMNSIDLQHPDILGLSFAVYNDKSPDFRRSIISVHAHLPGEDHVFYREVERKAQGHVTWLYIPLGPQEAITEIWATKAIEGHSATSGNHGHWHYWQLLFKTSKGLVHQIGSTTHGLSRWKLVYSSSQGLKRIFFEHTDDTQLDDWILGFEHSDSGHVVTEARQPRSDDHPTLGWPHFFHHLPKANCSSASLDGVIEVTQCLRIPNNHRSPGIGKYTSGLLLRYQDGHVERLGEARLDLVKSCKVLPTDVLQFRFQLWLVKTCTVGPAQGNDGSTARYAEIPMRGTLHWCFNEQVVWLMHNKKMIPPRTSH
ncbi:unnamed protein product [Clonostachys solani]|uniref:Uncharacterized protein n=1 Tax=Clonostachys solani TaxID=160281 RepID=A0A9N9Z5B9_9HYPO|nr:unnamed protein product [Clonostachys solani]